MGWEGGIVGSRQASDGRRIGLVAALLLLPQAIFFTVPPRCAGKNWICLATVIKVPISAQSPVRRLLLNVTDGDVDLG